jgi:hypothetical protein
MPALPPAESVFPLDRMMRFPKPHRTRRQERARTKRAQTRLMAAVRADLVRRDTSCRVCGSRFASSQPEAHHLVFRSAGGETSTQNMVLLCAPCHHQAVHGRIIDLIPVDPTLGADGPITVKPRPPKRPVPRQSVRGGEENYQGEESER